MRSEFFFVIALVLQLASHIDQISAYIEDFLASSALVHCLLLLSTNWSIQYTYDNVQNQSTPIVHTEPPASVVSSFTFLSIVPRHALQQRQTALHIPISQINSRGTFIKRSIVPMA